MVVYERVTLTVSTPDPPHTLHTHDNTVISFVVSVTREHQSL